MRTITRSSILFAAALCFACTDDKASVDTDTDTDAETDDEVGETTTDDGESSSTGEETTDDTSGFVPEEDIPSVNDCDPFAQDCPDGEKCVAYASSGGTWDANKCVMVDGDGAFGDPCVYDGAAAGTDDCNEETVCWNALDVDGVLQGTCFEFCGGTAENPMCDAGTTCRIVNEGTITVCLPDCDPLLQECDEGLGCYFSGGSNTFQCIIVAGDGIPTGDPCGFNNDCAPGNFCAAADVLNNCNGSACCAVFCDLLEDPDPCADPYQCVPFFDEGTAPPQYQDLGVCINPI